MTTDIEKLKELLAKATKGPWPDLFPECTFCGKISDTKSNQELVLALVNSAPALLSELEALRAFVEEVRGMDVEREGKWLPSSYMVFQELNKAWYSQRDAALKRLEERMK